MTPYLRPSDLFAQAAGKAQMKRNWLRRLDSHGVVIEGNMERTMGKRGWLCLSRWAFVVGPCSKAVGTGVTSFQT